MNKFFLDFFTTRLSDSLTERWNLGNNFFFYIVSSFPKYSEKYVVNFES